MIIYTLYDNFPRLVFSFQINDVEGRDGQWLWRAGNRGFLLIIVYTHTRITVYPLGNCLNGYTHNRNRLKTVNHTHNWVPI